MAYRIELAAEATANMRDILSLINANSSQSAANWYRALRRLIRTLDESPQRGSS